MSSVAVDFVQRSLATLEQHGFRISTDLTFEESPIAGVAHRSRFEFTKFGNCETFFVFLNCPDKNEATIRNVSNMAFRYAKQNKAFGLPCGFFESVFCFPVCIVPAIEPIVAESIRNVTPKMRWAAAEIPVLFDCITGQLCYFEKTPE